MNLQRDYKSTRDHRKKGGVIGSKNATQEAFQNELLADGQV